MLGSIKSASGWKWAAFGKHPLAGDYFYTGPDDPFFQAFSGWVENGWRQVSPGRKNSPNQYSWRFWTKGHQKDTLLCGVSRDSFDTIGRPYPLVLMGVGTLPGWQRHLAYLPFAMEKIWTQMEYLATKRYMDFGQLESDIRRLPVPDAGWKALKRVQQQRWDAWQTAPAQENIKRILISHADAPEFMAPFDNTACQDATTAAGLWYFLIMAQNGLPPNAAFLGGEQNKTYLAIFRRPLIVPDFIRLWSVGTGTASATG